jgi:hypothetical protein
MSSDRAPVIPDIAIRWTLLNSCSSNYSLAALSNVNKAWRSIVIQFTKAYLETVISNKPTPEYEHFSTLLLPEISLEIVRRSLNEHSKVSPLHNEHRSSFCLAWFPPSGIKMQSVVLNDSDLYSSSESKSDEDENDEMYFYRQRLQQQRENELRNRIESSEDVTVLCSTEWKGYRSANDILFPLGYSTLFVEVSFPSTALCSLLLSISYVLTPAQHLEH